MPETWDDLDALCTRYALTWDDVNDMPWLWR